LCVTLLRLDSHQVRHFYASMAEKYAPNGKVSSLLDALDSSAFPSESPRNQAPAAFSESPLHNLNASQYQTPPSRRLVSSQEASCSGVGGAGALDSARAAQRLNHAVMSRTGKDLLYHLLRLTYTASHFRRRYGLPLKLTGSITQGRK
jgi:hypothetical protein